MKRVAWLAAAAAAAALAVVLASTWFVSDATLLSLVARDGHVASGQLAPSAGDVRDALRRVAFGAMAVLAVAALIARFRDRLFTSARRDALLSGVLHFGCAAVMFHAWWRVGFEGEWYSIDALMTDPASVPVFGHRLLFLWPAMALHHALPSVTNLQCFFAVQFAVVLATVWVTSRWAAVFVGERLRVLGPMLLVLLFVPTIAYFTAYDIGIVLFFTAALLALMKDRLAWFAVLVGVGTLNHENALLLVPVAAWVLHGTRPRRTIVTACGAALALHVAARMAMRGLHPEDVPFQLRHWSNLWLFATLPRGLLEAALALVPWLAAGALAWRSASQPVRRMTLLLPLLAGVTFVFGQFNEARLFVAFFPVVIALVLSWIASRVRAADEPAGRCAATTHAVRYGTIVATPLPVDAT